MTEPRRPEPINLTMTSVVGENTILEQRDGINLLYISGSVLILTNDFGGISPDFLQVYNSWLKVFIQVRLGTINRSCDFIGAMKFTNEQILLLFSTGVFHGEDSFNINFI